MAALAAVTIRLVYNMPIRPVYMLFLAIMLYLHAQKHSSLHFHKIILTKSPTMLGNGQKMIFLYTCIRKNCAGKKKSKIRCLEFSQVTVCSTTWSDFHVVCIAVYWLLHTYVSAHGMIFLYTCIMLGESTKVLCKTVADTKVLCKTVADVIPKTT